MQGVTLIVAIIASLLVIALRPRYALAAYIASLLYYPYYLPITIGTIDILMGRAVVAVLLLRCLCDNRIRSKFVWCRLDKWVAFSMLVYFGVGLLCFVAPFPRRVEGQSGLLMDTWLAYMAARFIVTDKARLISLIKCIGILLVPLAVLGVVESLAGWRSFAHLWIYCPWYRETTVLQPRWGLTRAVGPFGHPILFGGGFAMFLPLIYYLRHERDHWRSWAYVLSGTALIGALSSMSSGPWVMAIVVVFCLAMEKHKMWVKPLLAIFLSFCIFTEIASDRHFYHPMVTWVNLAGGAGWHRARLIDVAFEHFGEWWLAGYGNVDPGWGHLFGMATTDVTNHFILTGVRYGLLGMIALFVVLATAFRGVLSTYRKTTDPNIRSLLWSLGSVLFSVVVAWMSVAFFGQLTTLFYCVLGVIGSVCSSNFNWGVRNRLSLAQNNLARTVT